MANREQRARVAAETLAIVEAGEYVARSGRRVSIAEALRRSVDASTLIRPEETTSLRQRAAEILAARHHETRFEVRNEPTLAATRRLSPMGQVAALNFASAKNPGGGFLSGSQAQEESLARASGLHACLQRHMDYYHANRSTASLLYTDHLIVSPAVPVFRDDEDQLLDEPWHATFLTSPAPNAGAIAKNQPELSGQIQPTFRRRIEQVLSAAVCFDQTSLVLGAWGCGVFGNEPETVARLFGEYLLDGPFARAFPHVTFAILDRQGQIIEPFKAHFGRA